MYYPRFTKIVVNYVMEKDDPMFTTINVISRNEATQLYGAILPVALTNEDIRNSESYTEYYAKASGTIPPKTKGSKKKANTDIINQQKPPTTPKEKMSGKAKQKTTELENISEADLTEAEQLKIIIKKKPSRNTQFSCQWFCDDDQDDDQAQDDEDADKNDVNETTQDDEDDDVHDDDENAQEDDDEHDDDKKADDDDDEELTESDEDGDGFVHPKLTTHDDEIIHEEDTDEDDSSISTSNDEDEGTNVEGAKTGEEATYEENQGTEEVNDTNTDLDGRDKVMTDVED
ncbi:hypothetical protein Tco_0101193, partial [Tanacetum coccineum]